ncbi:MAG: 7-cyano-7-deazaguanine synthase QueC [Candidatus Aminicenantaceae bacterium]
MKSALILYSGGIDSTTSLYWARDRFDQISLLTFDYGQRHRIEVRAASELPGRLGIPQKVLTVDLTQIGGSALTDAGIRLPEHTTIEEIGDGLPLTYVPFRNGIFLSLGAAWAEVIETRDIVCGFNIIDSPNYPDARQAFVSAMEEAINTGSRAAFESSRFTLHAPFIGKTKSEIIKAGLALGADYSHSVSCYAGKEIPCSKCSACLMRQRAWQEAGEEDHLITRLKKEGRI